jgi:hypothetical protein
MFHSILYDYFMFNIIDDLFIKNVHRFVSTQKRSHIMYYPRSDNINMDSTKSGLIHVGSKLTTSYRKVEYVSYRPLLLEQTKSKRRLRISNCVLCLR